MQKCVVILNVGDLKKNINVLVDPKEKVRYRILGNLMLVILEKINLLVFFRKRYLYRCYEKIKGQKLMEKFL